MVVKRLLQLIAILLAVLWMPVTAHCSLETLPGLEFLHCESGAAENDCDEDVCAQIERPSYKVSDTETLVPQPQLVLCFQIISTETVPVDSPQPSTASPPELPPGWQFTTRTALAPRAPAFIS